jgi:hypothetical protein
MIQQMQILARTRTVLRILSLILLATTCARAQKLGLGAGLAVPSDRIAQLPSELYSQGWRGVGQEALSGYFIELRGRLGGSLALVGALSYNRFLEATSRYQDPSGNSVELITSQVVLPLSAGAELKFADGVFAPYASVEGTLNYFYRSFESPHGDVPVPFRVESTSDARFGAAFGGGLSIDLKLVKIDLAARLQFINLFGNRPASEPTTYYFQLGTIFYVGI